MKQKMWIRGALLVAALGGCQSGTDFGSTKDDPDGTQDIADALAQLPEATVLQYSTDGIPQYVVGDLGRIDAAQPAGLVADDSSLRASLPPLLKVFRLENKDLVLRKVNTDEMGARHFRYNQKFNGLDVVGGDLVVHVDVKGGIFGANGTIRGDIAPTLGSIAVSEGAANASIVNDARYAGLAGRAITASRMVYIQAQDGSLHKAYEQMVQGMNGKDPVADKVYVDAENGAVVEVHPTIHFARDRRTYTGNNTSSLPGTLRLSETSADTGDIDIDGAHHSAADTYAFYNTMYGRDSYNNAGATMVSTAHHQSNYCNAFWNGSQMAYGDGNASQGCGPLARSLDVGAHEMTHAVTQYESNLTYSGESGGINEAMSDMFGAAVESWVLGGRNGTFSLLDKVFLIGDEVLAPYLRKMCDPAADGSSRDVWSSGIGSIDVHYSSGPQNLVLCLLVKGGTHPRGKTSVMVPAIGFDKAIRIIYKMNADILTASSNYAAARNAGISAAQQLGYDQATQDAVACAYAAIMVGTAPASCGGSPPPPPPGDVVLSNGTPVSNLSDSTVGNMKFYKLDVPAGQGTLTFTISGGSGDADMYVQVGQHPTESVYQCRPYKSGNSETCTFSAPAAGSYFVGLRAYAAYSGVTLTGSYGGGGGGDPLLTNNVPVSNISGASGTNQYWRITVPAGTTVTTRISGGSGDSDLYTKFGTRPTTSSYACRPYLSGNSETCTNNSTTAGDWYVMLRGYTSFSSVTLISSF